MHSYKVTAKRQADAKKARYASGGTIGDNDGDAARDDYGLTAAGPSNSAKLDPPRDIGDGKTMPRLDRMPRKAFKKGGAVFEGSAKDKREDRTLAKKHGMSEKDWEKSPLDTKHDRQESENGLKTGGRVERASGGRVGKGKTTVNVIIGGPKAAPAAPMPVPVPVGGAGGPPMPPPRPPMPMTPPAGVPGAMPPGPGPMAAMGRKRGGRVEMTAGAGSGEGRLEKVEKYGKNAKG